MSFDPFESSSDSLIAPAKTAFAIAPNDASDLPRGAKAIYVGEGGDITLRPIGSGSDIVFRNALGGSILPVRVGAVRLTGTTATGLVGLV